MMRLVVTRSTLNTMSIDELWALHERIAADLAARLIVERKALELRLKQLNCVGLSKQTGSSVARRRYPKVFPKFRNPDHPSETWAGRGKQPRWLTAQLKTGKRIDDFRIDRVAA
jgi:DNA-binding protein H-NS